MRSAGAVEASPANSASGSGTAPSSGGSTSSASTLGKYRYAVARDTIASPATASLSGEPPPPPPPLHGRARPPRPRGAGAHVGRPPAAAAPLQQPRGRRQQVLSRPAALVVATGGRLRRCFRRLRRRRFRHGLVLWKLLDDRGHVEPHLL